jgi:hypothetical protein
MSSPYRPKSTTMTEAIVDTLFWPLVVILALIPVAAGITAFASRGTRQSPPPPAP